MCDFISWIEKNGEIYFLKNSDLEGKRFLEYNNFNAEWLNDISGHGAIRFFYPELKNGIKKECTDFSIPKNFPKQIVSAIKKGQMSLIDFDEGLLNKKGDDKYYSDRIDDKYNSDRKTLQWKIFKIKKYRNKNWL